MGERKVLVRYIPADFDPSIIPKFKRDKNRIMEVRMMLPFSMRCTVCGEYMGRGKKFNSRKEIVVGDDYMGIRKYRFIIKCSVCSGEIRFKTDPKNSDYECESGASRNFEVWKENESAISADAEEREREESYDAMKALENRTLDSKIEMDALDALDEIKAINQRHERIDTDSVIEETINKKKRMLLNNGLTDEDEALVKSIHFKTSAGGTNKQLDSDSDEENAANKQLDGPSDEGFGASNIRSALLAQSQQARGGGAGGSALLCKMPPPLIVRRKRKAEPAGLSGNCSGGDRGRDGTMKIGHTQPPSNVRSENGEGGIEEKIQPVPSCTMEVQGIVPVNTSKPISLQAPLLPITGLCSYGSDSD